jgi:1-acyl-sn-glycerol-3-phosphate acyltransferase
LKNYPNITEAKGLRRRHRMIQARLEILQAVEQKEITGEPLSLIEKKFLQKAQAYYSGKTTAEARDPLMDQVEFYFSQRYPDGDFSKPQDAHPSTKSILNMMETVIDHVEKSGWQQKREILKILESRRQKLLNAFTRYNLGEPLTPVDQILIEDVMGNASREENPTHQDHLVTAIMYNHVKPERLEQVLKAERIREASRSLIEKLPGQGRGTADPIQDSAEDLAQVMFNAAGEITGGPRSLLATANFGLKFAIYATCLAGMGVVDQIRRNVLKQKSDLYSQASPFIARHAMGSVNWRPVLSAQDARVLEEIRLEAEGLYPDTSPRPLALAGNHASWTDITTLMAVFPKMRFAYKHELEKIFFLRWALRAGGHHLIDRPVNNTKEEKEIAYRQVEESGRKMLETQISPTYFQSGTRSLTGAPGSPRPGIAHLAIATNALILGASILGTRQILGEEKLAFKQGLGTDRRIYIGFERIDPRETVNLDEAMAQRDISNDNTTAKTISSNIHEIVSDRFLQQLNQLREEARKGDAMAQAELAEQMAALQPGMNLVKEGSLTQVTDGETGKIQQGDYHPAKVWAKKNKTDFDVLKKITEWWDQS